MYNLYTEEKKINEKEQEIKIQKETKLSNIKHKMKTNNLVQNYQKRIKKFIIDVRLLLLIPLYRWLKKILIL